MNKILLCTLMYTQIMCHDFKFNRVRHKNTLQQTKIEESPFVKQLEELIKSLPNDLCNSDDEAASDSDDEVASENPFLQSSAHSTIAQASNKMSKQSAITSNCGNDVALKNPCTRLEAFSIIWEESSNEISKVPYSNVTNARNTTKPTAYKPVMLEGEPNELDSFDEV